MLQNHLIVISYVIKITIVLIGIGIKIIIHFIRGGSIFRLNAKIVPERDQSVTIFLKGSVVFSSWVPLQKQLNRFLKDEKNVTLDITETKLVDRRIRTKLDEWTKKFKENDLELSVRPRMTSIDD